LRFFATGVDGLLTAGPGFDPWSGSQEFNTLGALAPAAGSSVGAGDEKTNAAGIKEAPATGTESAVKDLSKQNGYFGHAAVKILMSPRIQKVAEVARMAGFQKQVDEFILSMNRAPLAARCFADAIRDMTFDDVRGILTGGDASATDFFRRKAHDKLYAAYKPIVACRRRSAKSARRARTRR
jgi:hypothetical protein